MKAVNYNNQSSDYVDQSKFNKNTNNCWFASAMNAHSYNITHRPNTLHFQHRVEDEAYKRFIMPKAWLNAKWWVERICSILWARKAPCDWGDTYFHSWLNKWYALVVTITVYQSSYDQWNNNQVISGASWKMIWWHVICLIKRDWKYYLLNSWWGDSIREIKSINDVYFKDWLWAWLITESAQWLSKWYLDYIAQNG